MPYITLVESIVMVILATVRTTWHVSDFCVTIRGNLHRVTNLDVFGPISDEVHEPRKRACPLKAVRARGSSIQPWPLFLSELDCGKSWNLLKVMDVQSCGRIAPSSAYVLAERSRFLAFADVLQLPGVAGLVAGRDPEMVTRPAIDRLPPGKICGQRWVTFPCAWVVGHTECMVRRFAASEM